MGCKTGAVLATLHGHRHTVHSVTFSPDGLELASASSDHTIRVWRTSNATIRLAIDTSDSVRSVVWSPDSQQLISASVYDERIKFWNSSNGVPIGRPSTGHTDYINSLAISFHDSFIATASDDTTVRLWDIKAHQQIGQALQHTTRVRCVVISPNGELLVSGDGKRVLLWSIKDTEQGEAEGRIKDDDETQHQQLLTIHDTHLHSQATNDEPTSISGSASYYSLNQASSSDHNHSLFDFLGVDTTVHNACISGNLSAAENLLTQDIDADSNNYSSYATRSIVLAQVSEWDKALQDSVKVRFSASYGAIHVLFGDIVHCHPTLFIGLYLQGHRPLRQPAVLGRHGSF
ncbi:WD40-repeat-containing domain protein [Suillus cothurnatus]|nr:WD40-repeat-containing domain protein [Suillus cothurnatus]